MAKAYIPFIMAGHPTLSATREAILALSEQKADYIELGVPFSDPTADGPINQLAAEVALTQGVHLGEIFNLVKSLRSQGCTTPIILFSYFNPILAFGLDNFIAAAVEANIQGVLIVDLPPEEGAPFFQKMKQSGIKAVLLASPTTNPERFSAYHEIDPLFIYYISRLAVTGTQNELPPHLESEVQQLRTHFPSQKIMVGFGISTSEQARQVATFADGVVIGSVLVNTLQNKGLIAFKKLSNDLCQMIHHAPATTSKISVTDTHNSSQ